MTALQLNIYPQGRDAIVNLPNTGTNAVQITHIGVTATAFDPNDYPMALPGELKRLTTFGGVTVAPDTIHVTLRDDSADSYSLRGFALYLADGTLFAMFGQAGVILEKSTQAVLLLSSDIRFVDIDANSIEFGDANFVNPPATTTVMGVTQYATNPEALAGAVDNRSITASALKYVLDSRFGLFAPTEFMKGLLSIATAAGLRLSLELKSAALKDEGHGNGLNADLLDGQHGSYYATAAHSHTIATVTGLQTALDAKAPLVSPVLTGTPTAPTPATNDNTTRVATTAFVQALIANLIASAPGALDTLNELAVALGNDPNFAATMTNALALKAPLASPGLSGTPTAPTAAPGTNTTQLATTAFVAALGALKANLASPTFTGTPAAPTPGAGNSTTQLATTEFVQAAINAALATALANYLPKNNPTFTGVMTGPSYNKTP